MATQLVNDLLKKVSEFEEKSYKSISVEKQLELDYDLGHLTAFDSNIIDLKTYRQNKEEFIKNLARDNTQLIVNKLWDLETERIDNFVVAKLPSARTILPRSKPIPKPKMPTKWELFAKQKGIQKKKKDKLVWDEETKEWKPKYGYRGINQKKTNQWLIEIPDNADPNVDYFAKEKEEKNERIAKNEFQRLRNIARNQKLKVPGVGGLVPDQVSQSKDELLKASNLAKQSTASLGKFTESLPKEKPMKKLGKKRKFESNLSDLSAEKERNLAIISNLTNKKPKVNIDKAVDNVMKPQKFRAKTNNKLNLKKNKKSNKANNKTGKFNKKMKTGKNKFKNSSKNVSKK